MTRDRGCDFRSIERCCSRDGVGRWVDPHGGWRRRDAWHAAHEALRVPSERASKNVFSKREDVVGVTEVHIGRREICDAGVMMLVVVPAEEFPAVRERLVVAAVKAIG